MRWLWAALAAMTMNVFAEVDFKVVTQQNVTDAREIQVLRDELFLGNETIERVMITDLLSDGFDQNDAVVLYPTGRVLRLEPISERLDSLLRSFRLPANAEIYENRQYHTVFDSVAISSRGGKALGYGILAGLQERLARGYRGATIEGYFKFTNSGAQIRLWNFDSTRVSFPRLEPSRFDTVTVFIHDTVFVPEIVTVEKDPIIIRDTVYVPSELLEQPRNLFYREALGMLGGGYSMSQREASRGRLAFAAGNEWEFGVWDRWVAGRQEVNSRIGLRFTAELAPWTSDTLTARFLGTSAELMYIPAWDRSLFAFVGIRTLFQDNLFWDRVRAGWDDEKIGKYFNEPAAQDLGHYELATKFGVDKLAPYGAGKRVGLWMRLAAIWPGPDDSRYLMWQETSPEQFSVENQFWEWKLKSAFEVSGNLNYKFSDQTQITAGAGVHSNSGISFGSKVVSSDEVPDLPEVNSISASVFYQTIALRWTVMSSKSQRLRLEVGAQNNILNATFDNDTYKDRVETLFFPYIEAPMLDGSLQLDIDILQVNAGVKAYLPDGEDVQIRPFAGVYFLFK
ncbi:MAG: hypothetical protein IPP40_12490 [bacterium]|nr:hypothetical protein [bacterium]